MAGVGRLSVSGIAETGSRPAHKPMHSYRPAFDSIILGNNNIQTPGKLSEALGSLLRSARDRGVEGQVSGILRTYASEIKNDIVLLTLGRLQHFVENTPVDQLPKRLDQCATLMREHHGIADTIPEVVENIYKMAGKSSIPTDGLGKILRAGVRRSRTTCPKEISATIRTEYTQGNLDHIEGISGAAAQTQRIDSHVQSQEMPLDGRQEICGIVAEQIDPPFNRKSQIWLDDLKIPSSEPIETVSILQSIIPEDKPQIRTATGRVECECKPRTIEIAPEAAIFRKKEDVEKPQASNKLRIRNENTVLRQEGRAAQPLQTEKERGIPIISAPARYEIAEKKTEWMENKPVGIKGKNTKSTIVSKGIASDFAHNSYRGLVKIMPTADGARNFSQCDSLLVGNHCSANTFPYIEVKNNTAVLEHEASTSKINAEQMFYLRSRGLDLEESVSLIINGFCKDVFKELPLEFSVEAVKLLEMKLEGSVG